MRLSWATGNQADGNWMELEQKAIFSSNVRQQGMMHRGNRIVVVPSLYDWCMIWLSDSLTLSLSIVYYIYMYSTKYTWRVIGRKAQISRTWWKHAYTTRTMTMIYCIMMAYGIWNRYPDRYMQMVPGSQYAPNELHVHCSMILHFPVFSACSKTQHTHTKPVCWKDAFQQPPKPSFFTSQMMGILASPTSNTSKSTCLAWHLRCHDLPLTRWMSLSMAALFKKDCGGWEMDGRWWDMIPSKLRVRHLLTPMVGTPYMIFKNFA